MATDSVLSGAGKETKPTATVLLCEVGDRWQRALTAQWSELESYAGYQVLLRPASGNEILRIAPHISPLTIFWEISPRSKDVAVMADAMQRYHLYSGGPMQIAAFGLGWTVREAQALELSLLLRQAGAAAVLQAPEELSTGIELIARYLRNWPTGTPGIAR